MATYNLSATGDTLSLANGNATLQPFYRLDAVGKFEILGGGNAALVRSYTPLNAQGFATTIISGSASLVYTPLNFRVLAAEGGFVNSLGGSAEFIYFSGGIRPPLLGTRVAVLTHHVTDKGEG